MPVAALPPVIKALPPTWPIDILPLGEGERCTIFVATREVREETIHMIVESNFGNEDVLVEGPTAAPAAPATPAPAT